MSAIGSSVKSIDSAGVIKDNTDVAEYYFPNKESFYFREVNLPIQAPQPQSDEVEKIFRTLLMQSLKNPFFFSGYVYTSFLTWFDHMDQSIARVFPPMRHFLKLLVRILDLVVLIAVAIPLMMGIFGVLAARRCVVYVLEELLNWLTEKHYAEFVQREQPLNFSKTQVNGLLDNLHKELGQVQPVTASAEGQIDIRQYTEVFKNFLNQMLGNPREATQWGTAQIVKNIWLFIEKKLSVPCSPFVVARALREVLQKPLPKGGLNILEALMQKTLSFLLFLPLVLAASLVELARFTTLTTMVLGTFVVSLLQTSLRLTFSTPVGLWNKCFGQSLPERVPLSGDTQTRRVSQTTTPYSGESYSPRQRMPQELSVGIGANQNPSMVSS